jgi:uncharacterized protein YndB with AHSA1/START domain
MKIVKAVLLLILVVVVCVLGLALTRPGTYHVERSTNIATSPATVFAVVNDFHNWPAWSPWEKLDPAMRRNYEGAPSGKDAAYSWVGNDKAGTGRMTIIESQPDSRIAMRLEFEKPMKDTSQASFAFSPEGSGTKVTWALDGNLNFLGKVMCVFASMDKMVGPDFEKGLGSLKTLAESAPPAAADTSATPTPATTGK